MVFWEIWYSFSFKNWLLHGANYMCRCLRKFIPEDSCSFQHWTIIWLHEVSSLMKCWCYQLKKHFKQIYSLVTVRLFFLKCVCNRPIIPCSTGKLWVTRSLHNWHNFARFSSSHLKWALKIFLEWHWAIFSNSLFSRTTHDFLHEPGLKSHFENYFIIEEDWKIHNVTKFQVIL